MLELLPFLESEPFHDFCHSIRRAEVAHQIVFETDVESRCAWVALACAAPTQLSIDPARFVALGPDHHQPAPVRNARAEFNIGAAASHVRRNRDRAWLAGPRHDLSFLHVKFRVQNVVWNFLSLQHSAEQLRGFHAHRTDQHRLLLVVGLSNFVDNRVVFFAPGFVDPIVVVRARDWPIRRNHIDVEFVNVVELGRFGFGCTGHAGQFLIEAEIILDGNGRQCLRFAIDLDAFLRLDRLM